MHIQIDKDDYEQLKVTLQSIIEDLDNEATEDINSDYIARRLDDILETLQSGECYDESDDEEE